jgi:hypothetical protein
LHDCQLSGHFNQILKLVATKAACLLGQLTNQLCLLLLKYGLIAPHFAHSRLVTETEFVFVF